MLKISKNKYINRSFFKKIFNNKFKIKTPLKLKFKENTNLKTNSNYIYYTPFFKKPLNSSFVNFFFFDFYQKKYNWIEKKFFTIKYHKLIEILKNKNQKIIFKYDLKKKIIKTPRNKIIQNFIYNYNFFFSSLFIELFFFSKLNILKNKNYRLYYLILSFKKNKIFINLKNFFKKNFLSVSSGLFIKFFEKKKSFKKNKTLKLLMIKYMRKIFLITKILNTILIFKKTPKMLNEIINFLNLPIAHKFLNPVDNKFIEESSSTPIWIKFFYFIFIENKNFTKNKTSQRGRIKRKILRKVTFENKLID